MIVNVFFFIRSLFLPELQEHDGVVKGVNIAHPQLTDNRVSLGVIEDLQIGHSRIQ
jgi:hypothetical protein